MEETNHISPASRGLPVVAVVAVAVGVVLRFWPRSSLWLDEALSANIASLPVGRMGEALRHDGHPPLYYLLLHFWMKITGDSDWGTRALSGVISTLTLPLAYLAGRRLGRRPGAEFLGAHRVGLICVSLFATMPFAIRYGAETRMYALVMLLVTSGYLLVDELLKDRAEDALTPADTRRFGVLGVAAALNTTALLWTHYWSIWLLGAVGIITLVTMWLRRNRQDRAATWRGPVWLLGSLVVGGVLFIPWLPSMSFQAAHTGTPWGTKFGPVSVLVITLVDFAGARFGIAQFLSYFLVVFIVGAAVIRIRANDDVTGADDELVVDGGIHPRIRPELTILMLTLGLGWAVAWSSGNTYSSRYGSVIFPLFVLILAAGISLLRRPGVTVTAVSLVCIASLFGAVGATMEDRTQAGQIIDAVTSDMAEHPGPAVVVACPDQLGVALQRELDKHPDTSAITGPVIPFPTAGDPRFVDWVDYSERNTAADPTKFVERIQPRITSGTTVYLVSNVHYRTLEGKCEQLAEILATGHPHETLVDINTEGLDESADLRVIRPS